MLVKDFLLAACLNGGMNVNHMIGMYTSNVIVPYYNENNVWQKRSKNYFTEHAKIGHETYWRGLFILPFDKPIS